MAKKNWFDIKAQAGEVPATVSIYDEIGIWGVTAKQFLGQLKSLNATKINLELNSPGGSLIDGIAIYNGLRNSGAEITVRIMGIAASIASVIAMAGNKIIMPENTFMMIHSPANNYAGGNANELREMADLLDKVETSIIATYVARTGKTTEEIKALLDAETMMTAAEAVEMGFADEIESALRLTANFELENLPTNVQEVFKNAAPSQTGQEPNTPQQDPALIQNEATFAAQVGALADKVGMKDYVAHWLLDAQIVNLDQARTIINEAVQIRELCNFANMAEVAPKLIQARKSLAESREILCKARADITDARNIDNFQPSNKKPPIDVPQAAISPAEIYAARRKH